VRWAAVIVVIAGAVCLSGRRRTTKGLSVDAATGKELWSLPFASVHDECAGPRSTPLIDGDRVYVQSCNGEFRCLGLADGHTIWKTSFEKDFGVVFLGSKANEGTAARRGNNGSGVIDSERIILPVGSTNGASLVCFDKKIGTVIWRSQDDEAAYSSLMVATLAASNKSSRSPPKDS
jgi:outer membrane protein assembly factor BamB